MPWFTSAKEAPPSTVCQIPACSVPTQKVRSAAKLGETATALIAPLFSRVASCCQRLPLSVEEKQISSIIADDNFIWLNRVKGDRSNFSLPCHH